MLGTCTIALKCFSQNVWADNTHPLGAFVYQTLNQTDFDFFNRNYPYSPRFQLGIGKPNISEANATSGYWDVSMQDLFKSKGNQDFTKQKHCGFSLSERKRLAWVFCSFVEGCSFILHLQMSDPTSMSNYGAPAVIYVKYTGNVVSKQMSSNVDYTHFMNNKFTLTKDKISWHSW